MAVDVPNPANGVGREGPDDIGDLAPDVEIAVGEGKPFPGDDADPNEVDSQVLVDRGHRLPDDRLAAQMLTYPDRGLPDLGLQAGAFALPLPDPVAIIREEIDRQAQISYIGWPSRDHARLAVAERTPAHRGRDGVQMAAQPAQGRPNGEHREDETERQDSPGPARADAQSALAPRREDVALLSQASPQPVGLVGEHVGTRRGPGVEHGRGGAAGRAATA